jgi:transcriptional regulator with XRE-family HTH domain
MNISLANKLSLLRRDAGLSEDELAAFINVLTERIIAWERAESEPTASELFEISKLYHVSIDELIKSEQFDTSMPISLKKERPSVSLSPERENNFIREKLPENPTDREVYPVGYKGGAGANGAGFAGGLGAGFADGTGAGFTGGAGSGFAGDAGAGFAGSAGSGFAGGTSSGFAGSGSTGAGGKGGVQFIGADSERFQNAPYTKAEDIKPRDFSHIAYDEPQNPNINIKTVNDSAGNTN